MEIRPFHLRNDAFLKSKSETTYFENYFLNTKRRIFTGFFFRHHRRSKVKRETYIDSLITLGLSEQEFFISIYLQLLSFVLN